MEKSLKELGINLIVVNGAHHFMHATTMSNSQVDDKFTETARLVSVISPEEKRNIIGDTFMQVCRNVKFCHLYENKCTLNLACMQLISSTIYGTPVSAYDCN